MDLNLTPTISSAYLAALLDAAEVPQAQARELMAEVGIPPGLLDQPAARITERQLASLYRLMAVRLDDEMPRFFSRPLRPGALKFTCLSLLGAPDLRVALHRWKNVHRLLQDDFVMEVQPTGPTLSRIALVLPADRPFVAKPMGIELMLKLLYGVCSWLTASRLALVRVDFAFARPAFATEDHGLYPGPVLFGQPVSALHVETASLHLPIRRQARDLPEFLRRAPEGWMFPSFKDETLAQCLRTLLASRLPEATHAETAAQQLNMSLRTLHRRLADEGTSYQSIKDELRRDIAIQKLSRSREPLAAISADLGFDSTASFHRAFRGWTGDTPGAYRDARTAG